MANINAPKGFIPKYHFDGAPWNGQTKAFLCQAADASSAVYVGDIVVHSGTAGTAGTIVSGLDCEGMPAIVRASTGTTGQNIVGVVTGFLPDPTNLMNKYRLVSTNRIALVCIDPTVVYEAEEDAVTTPLVAADIGLNVAFSTTAGSSVTGVSGMELVSASKATTATLPLKLLGLVKRADNAFNTGGAGVDKGKFEVALNTGLFFANVAGQA